MKKFRNLLRLLIFGSSFFIAQPSFALQGGQSVNASDYPGLVVLSYDGPYSTTQFDNCTGIILEKRRILTTAECVTTFNLSTLNREPIPSSNIYVRPVTGNEVGGSTLSPPVRPSDSDLRVSSYTVHPNYVSYLDAYALVILRLTSNAIQPPAVFYNGNNKFAGSPGKALGLKKGQRQINVGSPMFPIYLTSNFYTLQSLNFNVIEGNNSINGLCFDDNPDTNTLFCGGFRNANKFLEDQDIGAPIYRTVNGVRTVIGLLSDASNAVILNGQYQYEKYARISSMLNFIRQNAPNTQFWNESSVLPEFPISIAPILQLLLLDE